MGETRLKSVGIRGKRDLEKERYWRHKIAEWRKSGLTARAFCQAHGINEANLFSWQRELAKRDREGVLAGTRKVKTAKPITGRGRTKPTGRRHAGTRGESSKEQESPDNAFVRLRVVPDDVTAEKAISGESPANGLVITTPAGYQIWLTSTGDVGLLGSVVRALEETRC
jgi:hypothetical protein